MELIIVTVALAALIFRKEIRGKVDRLVIWAKARKSVNKVDHIIRQNHSVHERLSKASVCLKEAYQDIIQRIDLMRSEAAELAARGPVVKVAPGTEEIEAIKVTVDALYDKLSSPEAEQINATYMQGLGSLSKAADAQLASQERIEKLLTLIVNRLNNTA